VYKFADSKNSEIFFRWSNLCIRSGNEEAYASIASFIQGQGRMKFVRPLYKGLFQRGGSAKELAVETFTANRHNYHPICAKMVATDLQLN
jgi:leukotriene-A4 hydrolase